MGFMGMPRGDPNGDIGIAQMADNAAAEKSGPAKYSHASRRHDAKVSGRFRVSYSHFGCSSSDQSRNRPGLAEGDRGLGVVGFRNSRIEFARALARACQAALSGGGANDLFVPRQIAARCSVSLDGMAWSFPSRSSMRPARLCRAIAAPTWVGRAPLHAAVISCCVLPVAKASTWSSRVGEVRRRAVAFAALVRPRERAGAVAFVVVLGVLAEAVFLGHVPC